MLTAEMAARREKSPAAAVASAETQLMVTAALEELDDEMRLVVLLRDGEDMEYAEIADVLNTPVGTVKSRLHRARNELREKLKDLVS